MLGGHLRMAFRRHKFLELCEPLLPACLSRIPYPTIERLKTFPPVRREALLSCSIKTGFNADLALFVGSLAAAQSVESIGNSAPVSKAQLIKTFIQILL